MHFTKVIFGALHVLAHNKQIPFQGVESLLERCQRPTHPAIIPLQPCLTEPGGQLVHSLSESDADVLSVTLSKNNKYAVTCE